MKKKLDIHLYRVDFSRFPRNVEEVMNNKCASDICKALTNGRSSYALSNFENSLPDGHIITSMVISSFSQKESGSSLIHIVRKKYQYPEAKILSWDSID